MKQKNKPEDLSKENPSGYRTLTKEEGHAMIIEARMRAKRAVQKILEEERMEAEKKK